MPLGKRKNATKSSLPFFPERFEIHLIFDISQEIDFFGNSAFKSIFEIRALLYDRLDFGLLLPPWSVRKPFRVVKVTKRYLGE